ncbi:Quinone oxidoreductase 2 [Talaromyces pinophilus]|nr:Quinone oxidoreductase 2 [Talaromyces pinophilus]
MMLKYLITGATGGLGSRVLAYLVANVPRSEYAATPSQEANRASFEKHGIAFRVANYDNPATLDTAFEDVENLFFVSTENFDTAGGVYDCTVTLLRLLSGWVWYTSLGFGGLRSDSKIGVQKAHLETEKILQESGLTYTSIREGLYAEIFPIFLQWYPNTKRSMLQRGGYENEIILLTSNEALHAADVVRIINQTTNRQVELVLTTPEEYAKFRKDNDESKKSDSYWQHVFNCLKVLRKVIRKCLIR